MGLDSYLLRFRRTLVWTRDAIAGNLADMPRRLNRDHGESAQARPIPARCQRDAAVAAMAAEAEGVLDDDELRSCGLDASAISRRARAGRLHRLYEGVYAVGHPNVSLKGRFVAAAKACRPHAALSHHAAGADCGIQPWKDRDIEVTVWDGVDHRHAGIQVHRSSLITRSDCVISAGILVTKPTWTVVALASELQAPALRDVVRAALKEQLVSVRGLLLLLDRLGPVRGSRVLRDILSRALPTRSELEEVVLDVIEAGGFEAPAVNEPLSLDGRIVIPDFRWPEQKLVLEADGAAWHDDPLTRAYDAERQTLLEARGETVLRTRWQEATKAPTRLQKRLAQANAPFL
jgi:very-short-patch-repair endonuclease